MISRSHASLSIACSPLSAALLTSAITSLPSVLRPDSLSCPYTAFAFDRKNITCTLVFRGSRFAFRFAFFPHRHRHRCQNKGAKWLLPRAPLRLPLPLALLPLVLSSASISSNPSGSSSSSSFTPATPPAAGQRVSTRLAAKGGVHIDPYTHAALIDVAPRPPSSSSNSSSAFSFASSSSHPQTGDSSSSSFSFSG